MALLAAPPLAGRGEATPTSYTLRPSRQRGEAAPAGELDRGRERVVAGALHAPDRYGSTRASDRKAGRAAGGMVERSALAQLQVPAGDGAHVGERRRGQGRRVR